MKQDVAEMWVRDLRTPGREQATGSLANRDRSAHCCLGRLCEVAITNGISVEVIEASPNTDDVTSWRTMYGGRSTYLPDSVIEWAGLKSECPGYHDDKGRSIGFADLNDTGKSFAEIADVIEQNWKRIA